ncbi:MAG: hypothetical protein PHW95_00460 [Patescibacteria group bacterium]|nr:hypothetical protein [Patescibacteria group bacterium]
MTNSWVSSVIILFLMTVLSWTLIFSRRWRLFVAAFFLLLWLAIDLINFYDALNVLLGTGIKLGSELSYLVNSNV